MRTKCRISAKGKIMSVEAPAMSSGPTMNLPMGSISAPSLGVEFSMPAIGGSLASFGPEISPVSINVGDTNQPSLNSDIFSMPELTTPIVDLGGIYQPESLEVLEGGKAIRNISPIDFDAVLIQIQESNLTPKIELPIPEIQPAQAEVMISSQNIQPEPPTNLGIQTNELVEESLGGELTANKLIAEQGLNVGQEIIADAQQAARVEDALMAIGTPKAEAHATALMAFVQTQRKNQRIGEQQFGFKDEPKKLPMPRFIHDEKADLAREKAVGMIFEQVTERAIRDGKEEIAGYDLVKEMPDNPQPTQVKSEIVKEGQDGSFESLIKEIKGIAKIKLGENIKNIILKLINNNHAVKLTDTLSAHEATREEVAKVVKSGVIFDTKI